MRTNCHCLILLPLILLLQEVPTCLAFAPIHRTAYASSCDLALRVYTPEQAEDDKKVQQEAASTSDEVLKSLTEKFDKSSSSGAPKDKDNKAMAFLRKRGKVGGAANKDFANAVGSDEGSGMAAPKSTASTASPQKAKLAFKDSITSGVIDDISELFPLTCSGSEWRGVSDRVRGGQSEGVILREEVEGRAANVLKGHVRLQDGNGFIQMVTDFSMDPIKGSVDASNYDGIELDVFSRDILSFNIHLRTPGSLQEASYRHTVNLEVLFSWQTIRIPFSSFVETGKEGSDSYIDYSKLKRLGVVVLDQETDVELAVGGVRFYSVF